MKDKSFIRNEAFLWIIKMLISISKYQPPREISEKHNSTWKLKKSTKLENCSRKTSSESEEKVRNANVFYCEQNKTVINCDFYIINKLKKTKTKFLLIVCQWANQGTKTDTDTGQASRTLPIFLISITLYFAPFVCHAKKKEDIIIITNKRKWENAVCDDKVWNSKLEAHVGNVFCFESVMA